jgi:hypothetical protein
MKLYGYPDVDLSVEETTPSSLAEVTLCASPAELRKISQFLASCASEMESLGSRYSQVHLADRLKDFSTSPHFVVAPAEDNVL